MLLRERTLTDFIWRPDALSWVIAFLAGIVTVGLLTLTVQRVAPHRRARVRATRG